ncbi:MAG: outer membrane protein transport protein [Flavobacteriales bacterium]|nr:outer membrane protein transport protein [Flavobacteriales bacterium]
MKYIIVSVALFFTAFGASQEIYFSYDRINHSLNSLSNDYAQQGTARYSAMAGSMGALGGDISAMEVNPAGGAVFIKNNVTLSMQVNSVKNTTSLIDVSNSNTDTNFNINNVGGVAVFESKNKNKWKNFNLGVSYKRKDISSLVHASENDDVIFAEYNDYDPDDDNFSTLYTHINEVDGSKSKFGINLSANYDDKFYLGTNLNFHSTYLTQYDIIEERINQNNTIRTTDGQGTPYSLDVSGFSIGFGAIYKINQMVRVGLAYQSPAWNSIVEEFNYANIDNLGDYYGVGLGLSEFDNINTAGSLTGSVALVIGKSLALNADVIRNFNKNTKFDSPDIEIRENNLFINNAVQNSTEVRLGGEYRIDNFKLRAGYAYAQSPIKDDVKVVIDGEEVDFYGSKLIKNDSNTLSAGLGYTFGKFFADFAYQHHTTDFISVFGGGDYYNLDAYYTRFDYYPKTKRKTDNFILTFGWNF